MIAYFEDGRRWRTVIKENITYYILFKNGERMEIHKEFRFAIKNKLNFFADDIKIIICRKTRNEVGYDPDLAYFNGEVRYENIYMYLSINEFMAKTEI